MPFDLAPPPSRYTTIGQIGRGGMAEAILAEMRVGQGVTKLVVLKRMWADLASDADFVSMFVREARLSARMNHPNVVQTYEVLDEPKRPTLVMEYLDGQPLARILNRLAGPTALGLTLRLRIVTNILAALDYAHELTDFGGAPQGVVHRDVNPQNVFVTYTGQVKLLDFGVAKSLTAAYQTRPGSVRGKLGYMAPEQVVGAVTDRRADLFAVGVMLWEMVSGRRMWQGMTDGEIVRHLAGCLPLPPVPEVELPRGLQGICARALAARPQNRYASAAEFAGDLERLLVGSDDAHRRNLGRAICLGFGPERAARRSLIETHLRHYHPVPGVSAASGSAAKGERQVSAVQASVVLPPPAPAVQARHDEEGVGGTINLGDSELGSITIEEDDLGGTSEDAALDLAPHGNAHTNGGGVEARPTTTRVAVERPADPWRWGTFGLALATVVAISTSALSPLVARNRAHLASGNAPPTAGARTAMPTGPSPSSPSRSPAPPTIVVAPISTGGVDRVDAAAVPVAGVSPLRAWRVMPWRRGSASSARRPTHLVSGDEADPFQPTVPATHANQRVERRAPGGGDDDILQPSVDLSADAVGSEPAAADVTKAPPPSAVAAQKLAGRSSARSLDEADPFWR